MDDKLIAGAKQAFGGEAGTITLGAPVKDGACAGEPLVRAPLALMNRHGLIAGATGTGKTKSLQLIAEQLSAAGVPVFLADVKGDVSGIAVAGESNERVQTRAKDVGWAWHPASFPVELLSLSGKRGSHLRATVSSFGPLLLSKVLGLNPTQTSVLTLVFKYADDRDLELYDFGDLRAVLKHLSGPGAADLEQYGGMSKQTVGVLLREMVELESQGADEFFGEPEFDLADLIQTERDGRGLVSVLELTDVQVEQVVRLVRSKGVGVFFVTQSPKDVPPDILGQLGARVQHALRAFTPDDEKALKAAARTFPKTPFYDVEETLTSLGIGEALVTVLNANGSPTMPFATRMIPPASRMGPLTDAELAHRIGSSAQVKKYVQAIDRESAEEKLAAADTPAAGPGSTGRGAPVPVQEES